MKKIWLAFTISFLVALAIATVTPLVQSERSISLEGSFQQEATEFIATRSSRKGNTATLVEIQEKQATTQTKPQTFPVIFEGKTLFTFSANIGEVSSKNRARRASQIIQEVARDFAIPIDTITVVKYEGFRFLLADDSLILGLVKADAKAAGLSLDKLADEYLKKIKDTITQYREKRSLQYLIWGVIYALIATLLFILSLKTINLIYPKIYRQIDIRRAILFRPLRIQSFQILSAPQEAKIFFKGLNFTRWAIIVGIFYLYIPTVLSFFPWTERLGKTALFSLYNALAIVWNALIGYIPNLFIILITAFIAYYTIRLCRPLFKAIESGRISIPGFYQDWAQPTYKLTNFLIIALAAAIIFPYLPGFNSPAFQGISILIGALITFGGASAIANLIGGFIIVYTRSFQIGDRIKIDNFMGDVLERSILSTRIRTPNNEIVTIPNSSMIASSIMNYSAALRDINQPVILCTTITLGYDLSWRKVHQTLVEAALATPGVIDNPIPVVWQTSLDDFYISYQLRAYTTNPSQMGEIYSKLHQNIQDKCNKAGIEIMSPHYSSLRDGNQTTIPESYLPKDYQAPGFRLNPLSSQEAEGRSQEKTG